MNTSFKTPFVICAVGLFALGGTVFAGKMDAVVGDWKLNGSKSRFDPAPAMKSLETKVTDAGNGMYAYKSDWVEGDDTPGHLEFTTALDGKSVAVTGYSAVDSVKATMVNSTTIKAVFTKNGKVVERESQTLSADGKTVRDLDTGKDENGKPFTDHLVLERQ